MAASLTVGSRKRLSPRILIAEVRIRGKAITAYGQVTRDCGRRCPDAEIRRRHGEHGRAHKGDGRVARQRDHGRPGRRGVRGRHRRNGYRVRKLVTSFGTINLRIPKLRAGRYFPEDLIERYLRVDRAVIAAVSEMLTMPSSNRGISWSKLFVWPSPFFRIHRSRQLKILGDGRFPSFRRNGSYTNIRHAIRARSTGWSPRWPKAQLPRPPRRTSRPTAVEHHAHRGRRDARHRHLPLTAQRGQDAHRHKVADARHEAHRADDPHRRHRAGEHLAGHEQDHGLAG